MSQITIIGLGNLLLKDDSIGPRVIEELQKQGLPPGIDAIEGGGPFYQYFDVFARSKYILAVDALLGGGPPGTIYLLTPGEITRKKETVLLRHEDDFLSVLDIMGYYNLHPEVNIIGIEPKEITYSLNISPEIAVKLPLIVKTIRELSKQLLQSGTFSLYKQLAEIQR